MTIIKLADSTMRLVSIASNRHAPRPVRVYYDGGGIGHCKTVKNGIASAVRHMLATATKKVNITHDNIPICDVIWVGQTITIKWSRGTLNF